MACTADPPAAALELAARDASTPFAPGVTRTGKDDWFTLCCVCFSPPPFLFLFFFSCLSFLFSFTSSRGSATSCPQVAAGPNRGARGDRCGRGWCASTGASYSRVGVFVTGLARRVRALAERKPSMEKPRKKSQYAVSRAQRAGGAATVSHFVEKASVSIGVMAPTLAMLSPGLAALDALGSDGATGIRFRAWGSALWPTGSFRSRASSATGRSGLCVVGKRSARVPGFCDGRARNLPCVPPVSIKVFALFRARFLDATGGPRRRTGIAGARGLGGYLVPRGPRGAANDQFGPCVRGVPSASFSCHGSDLLEAEGRNCHLQARHWYGRVFVLPPAWAPPHWRWPRRRLPSLVDFESAGFAEVRSQCADSE